MVLRQCAGVACLYRCVSGFIIPDLTSTDNFGITSYNETQRKAATCARFLPDAVGTESFSFRIYFLAGLHITILKLSIL